MGNGCMSIKKTEKVHILGNDIGENKIENTKVEYTKNIKIENTKIENTKIENYNIKINNREPNPKEEKTGEMYSQYYKNGERILIPYHLSTLEKKEILDLY